MKKSLKKIVLLSGFVLGSSLIGTSFYLEKHKTFYKLYMPSKLIGFITIAGISGIALRPLLDDIIDYKTDGQSNGK